MGIEDVSKERPKVPQDCQLTFDDTTSEKQAKIRGRSHGASCGVRLQLYGGVAILLVQGSL
jgi:hypothetical protein